MKRSGASKGAKKIDAHNEGKLEGVNISTTRPDLESDDYTRAREIMDTGKGKDVPMKDQIDQWKKKNKGRDPITGMPLA